MQKHILCMACVSLAFAACGGSNNRSSQTTPAKTESSFDEPCEQDVENPCQQGMHDPCGHMADICGQTGDNPCGGVRASAEPARLAVPDWKSWTKVSKKRFYSMSHRQSWVDIYLPAAHAEAYVNGAPPPDGMKIVKAQYASADAQEPESLTVMVRQNGTTESNWFWGMYAADGQQAIRQGELGACISCHQSAGNDLLFRKLE